MMKWIDRMICMMIFMCQKAVQRIKERLSSYHQSTFIYSMRYRLGTILEGIYMKSSEVEIPRVLGKMLEYAKSSICTRRIPEEKYRKL